MSLKKYPYELSVWKNKLTDVGTLEETLGIIIGAHDMSYLGKATSIEFITKLNGTHSLTFSMPSKYFDSEKGEYVHNDFCDVIKDETKIKLYYKNEWYEFNVKKITENKKFKAISYVYYCEDSFIDELSRNGYEIQFDPALNNSVEEIGVFTEDILDKSLWKYKPEYNFGDFTEYREQKFYKIPLSQFGGSIAAYPIHFEVSYEDFLHDINTPKSYLLKFISKGDWNKKTLDEKYLFIDDLTTIINCKTSETRTLELGDDLARVREVFWDNYYEDNGFNLLQDKEVLQGEYIYVPINDLSTILGSVYCSNYKALEEPAIYGSFSEGGTKFALQPSSENPKDFVQILFIQDGDELRVDDGEVLSNNNYHYIIPIEEWNEALAPLQKNKHSLIHWTSPIDKTNTLVQNIKYTIKEKNDIAYTDGVTISTSTIDDFIWYPVYSDGYLEGYGELVFNQARKISITNRTEYNKNFDQYVTVYKNQQEEYDNKLYSEPELNNKNLRVCSKINTRQILPSLARNLVENGGKITSENGWEVRTQNVNAIQDLGTGSSYNLAKIDVQSTLQEENTNKEITLKELEELSGKPLDENISDFYLQILSPTINKTEDFSLEGRTELDYVLNFGIISQQKKIEKNKVYAIRMKTGNMETKKAEFSYRNSTKTTTVTKDIQNVVSKYKDTLSEYKKVLDLFFEVKESNSGDYKNELDVFYQLVKRFPTSNDAAKADKIKNVEKILTAILFGGKIRLWGENVIKGDIEVINYESEIALKGIVPIHDTGKTLDYEKFSNIAISSNTSTSDISFLKFYLQQLLGNRSNGLPILKGNQLTNKIVRAWADQYITYEKEFVKAINKDLERIIIGQGSVDINGNYNIQGAYDSFTKNKNVNDDKFISFENLFSLEDIVVVPYKNQLPIVRLQQTHYHIKDNNKWAWDVNTSIKTKVEDDVFLLFKANMTIENPYVGIKIESKPMSIIFDNILETVYTEQSVDGVLFSVKKNDDFYDNVNIELIPIDSYNCSKDFLDKVKYDASTGMISSSSAAELVWDDGFLINTRNKWSGKTSYENPVACNTFLKNENSNSSIPYIVMVSGTYQGIIYLSK